MTTGVAASAAPRVPPVTRSPVFMFTLPSIIAGQFPLLPTRSPTRLVPVGPFTAPIHHHPWHAPQTPRVVSSANHSRSTTVASTDFVAGQGFALREPHVATQGALDCTCLQRTLETGPRAMHVRTAPRRCAIEDEHAGAIAREPDQLALIIDRATTDASATRRMPRFCLRHSLKPSPPPCRSRPRCLASRLPARRPRPRARARSRRARRCRPSPSA